MDRLKLLSLTLAVIALSLGLAGCTTGDRDVTPPEQAAGQGQPGANAAAGTGSQPGMGDAAHTDMGAGAGAAQMSVKDAQAAYDAAKKAYAAAPKDEKAKKGLIDAANALGDANLMAADLPPKTKYPAALKYYREVLKIDPANESAKKNEELIVGIYKQMGRPVPGGG